MPNDSSRFSAEVPADGRKRASVPLPTAQRHPCGSRFRAGPASAACLPGLLSGVRRRGPLPTHVTLRTACVTLAFLAVTGCQRDEGDVGMPDASRYLVGQRPAEVLSISEAVAAVSEASGEAGNAAPSERADSESEAEIDERADTDGGADTEKAAGSTEVSVVGRIPGGDLAAIETKRAVFLMTVLPPEGEQGAEDPDHADNCPFCRRRAEQAPKAIVEIVDDATGEVISVDVREWLGIQTGDHVIATGHATYDANVDVLTVRTSKVWID